MNFISDLIHNLLSEDWIIRHGGIYIVMLVIFAETGLFLGFFLPGDSLLFVTGMIISNSTTPFEDPLVNLLYWLLLIIISGVLGNFLGYWFGKKSGPLLFQKKDTLLFKKKHLQQAKDFYDKRGGAAIIFARFLPIVRTFAPIVAGIVAMDVKKFSLYNILGCAAWVVSMVILGYMLGSNEFVKNNLEYIVIAIILVTTGPVLFKMFFSKKK